MLEPHQRNYPGRRQTLALDSSGQQARRQGICPTCGADAQFQFHGEQRWPQTVADKLGLAPLMHLWTCEACHSTFAEPIGDRT